MSRFIDISSSPLLFVIDTEPAPLSYPLAIAEFIRPSLSAPPILVRPRAPVIKDSCNDSDPFSKAALALSAITVLSPPRPLCFVG